jgi:GDP-L-fucose synthase
VVNWGSGTPRREFLHADDLARACLLLLERYDSDSPVNVGTGEDLTIRELSDTVASVVGYEGAIEWDPSQPDGTYRKVLDISKIAALGWAPAIKLSDGIAETYAWYESTAP